MSRLDALRESAYDVLIIGGGIHGCTAAWSLSRQGVKTGLIEKDDFGGAASANSEKVLHGGLRYLQQLDIIRMRDSIAARRRSLRLQPNGAQPKPFLMPTSGLFLRSKAAMLAAMMANDVISFDRNIGLAPESRISCGRLHNWSFLRSVAPALAGMGSGAAEWQDGLAQNTERFTLAFALTAEEQGATVSNYVKAEEMLYDGKRICGVRVRDQLTGDTAEIRAKVVVNATGGWLEEVNPAESKACSDKWLWARAYNIVIGRQLFGPYGVGLEAAVEYEHESSVIKRGKRNYFFVPWRQGTMIGTMYKTFTEKPDDCRLEPEEIEAYLQEINEIYPAAALTMDDVVFGQVGLMPARKLKGSDLSDDPAKDTRIIDAEKACRCPGLILIKGIKYTTGIQVAERVARLAMKKLGRVYDRHAPESIRGGDQLLTLESLQADCRAVGVDLAPDILEYHRIHYGTEALTVLQRCVKDATLGQRLAPKQGVIAADVVHAVECEQAMHLSDVVFRRTGLGSFGYPGQAVVARVAEQMAGLLQWNEARVADEITAVEEQYRRLGVAHTLKKK